MKSTALSKRRNCKWGNNVTPNTSTGRRQTFRFLKLLETILIRNVLGEKFHIVKITTTTKEKSVPFVRLTFTEFHARSYEINTLTVFKPTIAT